MNCKPGDLAVIVRHLCEHDKVNVGKVLRVKEIHTEASAVQRTPIWTSDDLPPGRGVRDDCLRPIRDPGEDARDESLNWLPVPTREMEQA